MSLNMVTNYLYFMIMTRYRSTEGIRISELILERYLGLVSI